MVEGRELTTFLLWLGVMILAIFCVVLLTINVWGLHFFREPLDYVRFGTWTQAIAGTATFLGVMVALASLLWQQAKTREENARKLMDEHTAVFLWLTSQVLQDETTHEAVGRHWDLEIQNLTKAPIYRWRVEFPGFQESLSNVSKRPLLPSQNVFNLPFLDNCAPQSIPIPAVFFEARDGLAWKRTATGLISRAGLEQLEVSATS
jgi:hypothetical protein